MVEFAIAGGPGRGITAALVVTEPASRRLRRQGRRPRLTRSWPGPGVAGPGSTADEVMAVLVSAGCGRSRAGVRSGQGRGRVADVGDRQQAGPSAAADKIVAA